MIRCFYFGKSFRKLISLIFSVAAATCAYSQQNLFNIPSGDITRKGKFFYQHQLNFYSLSDLESKSHLVYGLGRQWDVGINLVDVPIRVVSDSGVTNFNGYGGRKPLYPLLMATLQKQFHVGERLDINIGVQIGPNLANSIKDKRVAHFTYGTVRWKPFSKGFFIAGPYYTNDVFTGGKQHTVGWIVGYEIPVTKKFAFMGDLISGSHKKSVSTFGAMYDIGKRTQLCVAGLIPFPNQELPRGIVLELNVFGWEFKKDH